MKGLEDKELKYIINTHFHGDHTGSNQFFSHKAPIFAHENVRSRLSSKADHSAESLPVVTYKDGITIYLDNEEVQLTHLPKGHTDGDTYVYFKKANVLHTGDLFFEVGFPFIDLKSGGSVKGYLASAKHMLKNMPDDVVVIPGHGKLTNKESLLAFAEMIAFSIDRVTLALAAGKSEQQILDEGIGKKYKHLSWAFITEEKWLKTLIADLK
jgi:glyoxylase-like metal-dependent hydrolase (beta-lactamase superfamily II)